MEREGYMRSGTEGQIKVTVLESSDFSPTVGGVLIAGGILRCLVRFEEGKHKGEEPRWVPANYVAFHPLAGEAVREGEG